MHISLRSGAYQVYGDGQAVQSMIRRDVLILTIQDNAIKISTIHNVVGSYSKVEFREIAENSSLVLKSTNPILTQRAYEDNFIFTNAGGKLKIINHVHFDNYLAGVVQSEAGNRHHPEFYKVQAIICRTYALKHINRFKSQGFNLCDRVDSQVYKTMCFNDTIRQAVGATRDIVLVDPNIDLIAAVFHSNSGGNTINSEDVWSKAEPYLKAVSDTFSHCQPHYEWYNTFETKEYLNYFAKKYQIDVAQAPIRKYLLNFCPDERFAYMFPKQERVPLKTVRQDLKLNSTYFCVGECGDSVIVAGQGFGHGVGLSQEGAMKMALYGYTFIEILHHYYQNVHLVKLHLMDFFRDEE